MFDHGSKLFLNIRRINSKRHMAAKEAADKAAKEKAKAENLAAGKPAEKKAYVHFDAGPVFNFDQEMRHKTLFQFIADKQWDSVEAMFDAKVVYLCELFLSVR